MREPEDDDGFSDDFSFRKPEPFVILVGVGLAVLTIAGAIIEHSLFKAGAWR